MNNKPNVQPELRKLFGKLKGFERLVYDQPAKIVLDPDVFSNYNKTVTKIADILNDQDITDFIVPNQYLEDYGFGGGRGIRGDHLNMKLLPLLSYLEHGYALGDSVVEIGSIYNSIKDDELKSRVSDILTATGNFDRVINQATLVLEDRIRRKAKLEKDGLVGTNLVNKAINSKSASSILVLSSDDDQHEGFAHICRGIVLSFRNPTHHTITNQFSREDALKICAFIDNLLQVIDSAVKKK